MYDLKFVHLFYIFVLFAILCNALKGIGDVALGCPSRSYRFGDYCYFTSAIHATYYDSEKICQMGGGRLVPIKDEETYLTVRKVQLKHLQSFWIGLNDRKKEGEWVFSDGMRVEDFSSWAPGEPNNGLRKQNCGTMYGMEDFLWDDDMCDRKHLFICQFERTNCTKKDGNVLSPYCFELSEDFASYDEADMICRQKGGYLANVKTKSIHDFLKRLIVADKRLNAKTDADAEKMFNVHSSIIPTVWIGLQKDKGQWFFSDGSVIGKFNKWNEGEPNNLKGNEDCAEMKIGWNDDPCTFSHKFICQYTPTGIDSPIVGLIEDVFPIDKLADGDLTTKDAQMASSPKSGVEMSVNQFACLLFVFFLLGSTIPLCGWCLITHSPKARRYLNRLSRGNDDHRLQILENDTSCNQE